MNIVSGSYRANLYKLLRVRSVFGLVLMASLVVMFSGPLRAIVIALPQQGGSPLSSDDLPSELNGLSTGGVSFGALFLILGMSIWVSRDYSTGSYQLSHVLAGSTFREMTARVLAGGAVAAAFGAISGVFSQSLGTLILISLTGLEYSFTPDQAFAVIQIFIVISLSAALGVGLGYTVRSTALSVFLSLMIFVILPMALITGSLLGHPWMDSVYEFSPLGVMESALSADFPQSFISTLGLLLWTAAFLSFGFLNARRG